MCKSKPHASVSPEPIQSVNNIPVPVRKMWFSLLTELNFFHQSISIPSQKAIQPEPAPCHTPYPPTSDGRLLQASTPTPKDPGMWAEHTYFLGYCTWLVSIMALRQEMRRTTATGPSLTIAAPERTNGRGEHVARISSSFQVRISRGNL